MYGIVHIISVQGRPKGPPCPLTLFVVFWPLVQGSREKEDGLFWDLYKAYSLVLECVALFSWSRSTGKCPLTVVVTTASPALVEVLHKEGRKVLKEEDTLILAAGKSMNFGTYVHFP